MRRFDLLEKVEASQMDLLKFIVDAGGIAKTHELAAHLKTGPYFIARLIEGLTSLAEQSKGSFSIRVDKTTVLFDMKADYSLNKLFDEFIVCAPKYKILEEFFMTGSLDPVSLSKKLGISQSTYFRKINEINTLLKEFDLSIQNSCILGSELQIRHFYVSLYSTVDSDYLIQPGGVEPRINEQIQKIQKELGNLSYLARKKIAFYFLTIKKRYAQKIIPDFKRQSPFFVNKTELGSQKKFLVALQNSPLLKKLQLLLNSFLTYYSFKPFPDEALLLILFLLGEEIIPIDSSYFSELNTIEKQSNFFILQLTENFFDFMKKKYPTTSLARGEKNSLYAYLKLINYRHLILNGRITRYHDVDYNEWTKDKLVKTLHIFVNESKDKYPDLFIDNVNDTSLVEQYTYAINYYERCIQAKITVGIFIEGDFLYSDFFTRWWINQVELANFASAEELKKNSFYDLIISNVEYSRIKNKGKNFLFLTNENEEMDRNNLNEILRRIHFT